MGMSTVHVKVQDHTPSMMLSANRCKAGAPAFFHPFYSTAIRSSNLIYSSRFRTSNNRWMRWLRPWFKNVQWPPLLRCRRRLYAESAGSPIAAAMMPAAASGSTVAATRLFGHIVQSDGPRLWSLSSDDGRGRNRCLHPLLDGNLKPGKKDRVFYAKPSSVLHWLWGRRLR